MAHVPTVVGVSGSPTHPSRTTVLVDEVARSFAEAIGGSHRTIELAPLLGQLGAGPFRSHLGPEVVEALEAVEAADVIVVGSPAYRATYTGLFKLFFDHIGQYALVDKPIVLTATGGSDRHALLVEHQMRPLFGFFQSLTLPLGIYAAESDFADYAITSDDLRGRIDTAVNRTVPLVRAHIDPDSRYANAEFARPDAF
ncbi:FMN reductase [Leifsonia aquatica]|jgi:FMN reductase|uniref:FMN reductase n=2 Tax=Leifsonia aquatica TaxID=144185 RepID=U2RW94_LEIAQ|nr:FMN reductase [Leifsonia aquatica]ERK72799.1 FMN reductase [Leifsonia aquatica ATCC 14665]MBB2965306.1 FMN reductase [Leifsonia aquatica]